VADGNWTKIGTDVAMGIIITLYDILVHIIIIGSVFDDFLDQKVIILDPIRIDCRNLAQTWYKRCYGDHYHVV